MAGRAVYIATTNGPCRVQQITVDPGLRFGALGVNFTLSPSVMSRAYADFVSHDHGVVARHTAEERYRTRISHDIGQGSSWQLGMLVAHALQAVGGLAQRDRGRLPGETEADELASVSEVVWATGELDAGLNVLPVAEIDQKIRVSVDLLDACSAAGVPVRILVPAGNREDSEASLRAVVSQYPGVVVEYLHRAVFSADPWNSPSQAAGADLDEIGRLGDVRKPAAISRFSVLLAAGVAAIGITAATAQLFGEPAQRPDLLVAEQDVGSSVEWEPSSGVPSAELAPPDDDASENAPSDRRVGPAPPSGTGTGQTDSRAAPPQAGQEPPASKIPSPATDVHVPDPPAPAPSRPLSLSLSLRVASDVEACVEGRSSWRIERIAMSGEAIRLNLDGVPCAVLVDAGDLSGDATLLVIPKYESGDLQAAQRIRLRKGASEASIPLYRHFPSGAGTVRFELMPDTAEGPEAPFSAEMSW